MKKCPYCAEEIQDEAIVCRFCKRDLPAARARPVEPGTPPLVIAPWMRWALAGFVAVAAGTFLVAALVNSLTARHTASALEPVASNGTQESGNPAHLALLASSEEERSRALRQVIASTGEDCDLVVRTFHQGGSNAGEQFWDAACRNGRTFAVSIKNDPGGTTTVLSCDVLKAVANVDCFRPFKTQ